MAGGFHLSQLVRQILDRANPIALRPWLHFGSPRCRSNDAGRAPLRRRIGRVVDAIERERVAVFIDRVLFVSHAPSRTEVMTLVTERAVPQLGVLPNHLPVCHLTNDISSSAMRHRLSAVVRRVVNDAYAASRPSDGEVARQIVRSHLITSMKRWQYRPRAAG